MLRCALSRSVCRSPLKEARATVVVGEEGRRWKYDPDFEPKDPCLRAGLKGNPYGTRTNPFRSRVSDRALYRLPLSHPRWEQVYQTLDDLGVGRDWVDLTIPAVLPEFPMEAKKRNPHYRPGKYPTIRNAYYEQQKIQFAAEKAEHVRQFFYKKHRLQNRWKLEKKKHAAMERALQEISSEISEDIDQSVIDENTKELESSQEQTKQ